MPVPEFIRQQVDNAFTTGMEPADFGQRFLRLAQEILRLTWTSATDDEIGWAFAYIEYVIADRILSINPANPNQQLQYGAQMRSALRALYDERGAYWRLWYQSASLAGDESRRRNHELMVFGILRSMHSLNTAFYRVAQRSGEPVHRLSINAIEENLRQAIGNFIYGGTTIARIIYPTGDPQEVFATGRYAETRLVREGGIVRIQLGARQSRRATSSADWGTLTWDLNGLADVSERWNSVDRLAQATPNMRVIALQNPGRDLPSGAELVGTHHEPDQFGLTHNILEYRFQINRHRYRYFSYTGLRQTYQLGILTGEDFRIQYLVGVRIVADGYEATVQEEPTHRHAMGLLFSRNLDQANTASGVVFYTFLAGMQAENSSERVARLIAWHTDHNYAILGDFSRSPTTGTPPTEWLQLLGTGGRIFAPQSATYPSANPTVRFDYALANGTSANTTGVVQGQLHQAQQHRAVQYEFSFPQGPAPLPFRSVELSPR